MVEAYRTCQAECMSIQMAVDAARERLATVWTSDQAALVYRSAMEQWLSGFQRVRQGLNLLDTSMQHYAETIATAEEDSSSQAGQWTAS